MIGGANVLHEWEERVNYFLVNGIGSTNPQYTLDVAGSVRVSGTIFTLNFAMTMTGTFSNVFQYVSPAIYIVSFSESIAYSTFGVFIFNPLEATNFVSLSSNNIVGQISGGYLQIKSANGQSYAFSVSVLRLV